MTLGVFKDADFERIAALPTRPQEWDAEKSALAVELMTDHLKRPEGTMTLKPIQARALVEAADTGALVGEIGAGMGKFGLSALLFTLWGTKRGLLLVPAHLRQQTIEEWAKWSKHWKLLPLYELDAAAVTGPHVRILSYQSLSTVRFASFLDEFNPDVIIADEAHYLSRVKSARGKRFFRYLRAARKAANNFDAVKFVPLSGTMRRKSLKECAYLYEAALGDRSPVPITYPALEQWCYAIDEGVREDARIQPGALESFCTAEEKAQGLDGVRAGIRRRLVSTPSVIATSESCVGTPLVFQVRDIEVPQEVQEAMRRIRQEFTLPTGEQFQAGITAWNHAREVACGFAYHWDPPAPPEWAAARKGWNDFVAAAMDTDVLVTCQACSGAGKQYVAPVFGKPAPAPKKCPACDGRGKIKLNLDSPLMVWNAVASGKFGDPELVQPWVKWRAIRDTFEPNPVPSWISDYLVRDAEEWALKTGGIVWVSHTSAFTKAEGFVGAGEAEDDIGKLFKRIPYFGSGPAGEGIKTHKGPCVASVRAHGTGKNLTQWHEALWLCMPSSGSAVEQLAARHHRIGQLADEVRIYVYLHSREMFQALVTAQKDGRFMESINGNPQRINSSVILTADGHSFDPAPYEERMSRATGADDPMWSQNARQE